ncbi:hypothetical protein BGZ94_008356 [Podila epigama]|nr:hypothetical protein BGZ94_008356 [Podila epigama]
MSTLTSSTSASTLCAPSIHSHHTKKSRRFSLIRLFSSSKLSTATHSTASDDTASIASSDDDKIGAGVIPAAVAPHFRHSMVPTSSTSTTIKESSYTTTSSKSPSMKQDIMRERRKSIATMTDSSFRSPSLRFCSSRHHHQQKQQHQPEMNEKMRQFDELLQKRRGGTIRITLTPTLLQEPY